jgi:hypothetical protein
LGGNVPLPQNLAIFRFVGEFPPTHKQNTPGKCCINPLRCNELWMIPETAHRRNGKLNPSPYYILVHLGNFNAYYCKMKISPPNFLDDPNGGRYLSFF